MHLDFTPTLPAFARATAERYAARTVLVAEGERLSFAEAGRRSGELARGLLAQGVGKGTRVGIWMPNSVDWWISWLGVTRIGALAVPLNTFFQTRELAWALRHADLAHLLTRARFGSHDYLARLEDALPGLSGLDSRAPLHLRGTPALRAIHVWGECERGWARGGERELAAAGSAAGLDDAFLAQVESCVAPADPAVVIYTSGSTRDPKGVVHSHGSLVRHSLRMTDLYRVRGDDVVFSSMPFFWIGGLVAALLAGQHHGASLVTQSSFEAGAALELLERERVTYAIGWPHHGKALSEHPSFATRDLACLERSSMPDLLPPERRPPEIRSDSLGMTETCGSHTGLDPYVELAEEQRGTYGPSLEGLQHKLVDPSTGVELPPGGEGELCVRGDALMQGLYGREREEVFDPDGFYHTGDRAERDARGWIRFRGRLGEMIKTAGSNVTPDEVETALLVFDEIAEAHVVGIPDPDRGELVAAAVVPAPGRTVDAAELQLRLKSELSAYKLPRRIWVCAREQLPFTDSGKLKKGELARRIADSSAS